MGKWWYTDTCMYRDHKEDDKKKINNMRESGSDKEVHLVMICDNILFIHI